MSGLNLSPNPIIVIVQALIFLGCYKVIKHFFLIPYQKVKTKRMSLTYDVQEKATKLHQENLQMQNEIDSKIFDAMKQFNDMENKIIEEAKQQQIKILSELEQESKIMLNNTQQELQKEFNQAKQKAKEHIDMLVNKIYDKIIH